MLTSNPDDHLQVPAKDLRVKARYPHDEELDDPEEEEEEEDNDEEEEEEEYGEAEEDEECESSIDRNDDDRRQHLIKRIQYSDRYRDSEFEYRHVNLPRDLYADYVESRFKNRLLSEEEWRGIGIQQSVGWIHYELHKPEPHIFLFRRPI